MDVCGEENHFATAGLVMVLSTGCAKPVDKDWLSVGGSKSDATVRLAYTWDPRNEKPVTNRQQAIGLASEKCRVWGYERAEPFGTTITKCTRPLYDSLGWGICAEMTATAEFQCIGGTTTTMPDKGEAR